MEKITCLFKEGQSVTPIMQKFDDLKCAIARYNRVTAQSEKPKIAFAYGIITFIYDAIDALECYLADLENCECHDALALDFMELADALGQDLPLQTEVISGAGHRRLRQQRYPEMCPRTFRRGTKSSGCR